MKIIKVVDDEEKKKITRAILEALPEWFGIVEAREEYILDSVGKDFFCAMEKDKVVGFLYLKQTGKDTVELAVMGVLKEYHRKGIGRALFEYAKESIKESGYSFIQVKTVKMGMYKDYDEAISLTVKETRRHEPNPENRDVYEKTYKTYLNLYKSLEPMMRNEEEK